jgi:magnesium transporter
MTVRFVKVGPDWTVAETTAHLRKIDPEVATVADLYAVDEKGRLVGVMSLRKLLPAEPAQKVWQLMTHDVISVAPDTPQEEVARLVAKYGFNAMPVVSADGRALGVVTVDDVVDVLVAGETEAALAMGAVAAPSDPDEKHEFTYFGASVLQVVRSRAGWLLLLFVAETLTGTVLRHFEDELAKVVALSFFIPLIIGTGGNAGSQTVSTIIRAIALKEISVGNAFRVLLKESATGLILGTVLCLFAFARVLMWGTGAPLALTVGLTMLAVFLWANVIGAVVPLLASKLRIDPTVVSAPLITTIVDATGLAIYMLIAKSLLL